MFLLIFSFFTLKYLSTNAVICSQNHSSLHSVIYSIPDTLQHLSKSHQMTPCRIEHNSEVTNWFCHSQLMQSDQIAQNFPHKRNISIGIHCHNLFVISHYITAEWVRVSGVRRYNDVQFIFVFYRSVIISFDNQEYECSLFSQLSWQIWPLLFPLCTTQINSFSKENWCQFF